MEFEFKIGWCPFCNQGWAEVAKDVISNELLIICSECDTIWNSPQDFYNGKPDIDKMKTIKKVTGPTKEEIGINDWNKFIIKT